MAARAGVLTLDTAYRQVLVDFFNDPNFHWHHRILIIQGEGGIWICASPDHEIQSIDLTKHRVLTAKLRNRMMGLIVFHIFALSHVFSIGRSDLTDQ